MVVVFENDWAIILLPVPKPHRSMHHDSPPPSFPLAVLPNKSSVKHWSHTKLRTLSSFCKLACKAQRSTNKSFTAQINAGI